jgi:hypothetical protein
VGAVVNFNSFLFHLYDADEYCFAFMENNTNMFPLSDLNETMNRLKKIVASSNAGDVHNVFKQHDRENREFIGFETFFSVVKNHLGMLSSYLIIWQVLKKKMIQSLIAEVNDVYFRFFFSSW